MRLLNGPAPFLFKEKEIVHEFMRLAATTFWGQNHLSGGIQKTKEQMLLFQFKQSQ